MRFELTVLGVNSALPAHGRHPSAHFLNIQEDVFLIDCGEGTQMRLQEERLPFARIEHIFISHLHGDHIFGLIGLLTSLDLQRRTQPLDIFGPVGLEEIIGIQLKHVGRENFFFPCRFHTVLSNT
ncbi:MAG: MBL fold metallo-hydrolase, partial [Saprospiraceae bacterium]|nr:MBL fold metallo-hydrolase [Saprospiraceae bacterium]